MSYPPNDSLVGPLVSEIAKIIREQMSGVERIYENIPDGPPEDNSVLIHLNKFDVLDETNGKLSLQISFGVRHMIRRKEMGEAVDDCYSYIVPYLLVFSAWSNQRLGGLARLMSVENGGVTQFIEAGEPFLALIINLEVLTEFNIPT